MKLESISVVGLGKLGATTLAALASKGFNVIGVDINKDTVSKINKGIAPVFEPGLQDLLKKYGDRITATTNYDGVVDTDMTIIIVPTPSTPEGGFSTWYVEEAIGNIAIRLADKKRYHNIVITSTVLPGSVEEIVKPKLEILSNKKVGKDLGLCYNPDFIALGNIINGLLNPDMVLIGESDKRAGDMIEQMHKQLLMEKVTDKLGNKVPGYEICKTPIHRMSLYNAELAKITLNAYVTMKMSFANTIAEICENMPTGDSEAVLQAVGADTRIGTKYLKGALAYGGPCFPRDNKAFAYSASKYGVHALLARNTDMVNLQQNTRIVNLILKTLSEVGTNKLSVLGLTYKPDTVVTEESASLKIIQRLLKEGIKIEVYDPAKDAAYKDLSRDVVCWATPEACFDNNQVVFIATPWKEFKELKRETFLNYMKEKPIILDAWGILTFLRNDPDVDYRQIGVYHG